MTDRFGYEWQKYSEIRPEYRNPYREQFLNWTRPLPPESYRGKRILDAGCGMGRNGYWCLEWGAAHLVACDHDERSVRAARGTLAHFPNAEVLCCDLENLPWRNEFDFVFSIGVVHHTRDPEAVMRGLHDALKPGGEVLLWVYSKVGFRAYVALLQPVRLLVTRRMNLSLLHALTYFLSVPLFLYLRAVPQRKPYFRQLRTFAFSHLHSIVFDQLLPEIARYYTEAEARDLVKHFTNVSVYAPPNRNGWIVRGTKRG